MDKTRDGTIQPRGPRAGVSSTWHMNKTTAAIWRQAEWLGQHCTFRANQFIYDQGHTGPEFYFLLDGLIQLSSVYPDGHAFSFDTQGPDSLFGQMAALSGKPQLASAQAVKDSKLLRFDARRVLSALPRHPALGQALLGELADRQYALAQRLYHTAHMDSEICVGGLLREIARRDGLHHGNPGDSPVTLQLTHDQIASMTGLTRVTVSRTLKRMSRRGIVKLATRSITILDPRQLLVPAEEQHGSPGPPCCK